MLKSSSIVFLFASFLIASIPKDVLGSWLPQSFRTSKQSISINSPATWEVFSEEIYSWSSSLFSPSSQFVAPNTTITTCGNEDDLIAVDFVDVAPNPPKRGHPLVINAKGHLSETVVQGSYIDMVVKYGVIRLLAKRFDLCEEAAKIDKECPIEQGELFLNQTADLPNEIPPGKYIINVKAYLPDERQLTCLVITAFF